MSVEYVITKKLKSEHLDNKNKFTGPKSVPYNIVINILITTCPLCVYLCCFCQVLLKYYIFFKKKGKIRMAMDSTVRFCLNNPVEKGGIIFYKVLYRYKKQVSDNSLTLHKVSRTRSVFIKYLTVRTFITRNMVFQLITASFLSFTINRTNHY